MVPKVIIICLPNLKSIILDLSCGGRCVPVGGGGGRTSAKLTNLVCARLRYCTVLRARNNVFSINLFLLKVGFHLPPPPPPP